METRLNYFDVIKGICIIAIIITHISWTDTERLTLGFPFWIDMAVPVFMIISGYMSSLSYERNSIASLCDAYSFAFLGRKIIRYTIPFLIAFCIEISYFLCAGETYRIFKGGGLLWMVTVGGYWGPGSYYYPLMLQFIFVFPPIYFFIRENPKKGLIYALILNALYELAQRMYLLNEETYRLLLFRYTLLIAFGCYLQKEGKIYIKKLVVSFLVGIIFIIVVCYTAYEPYIIIYWTKTSFMAAFYIMPIFYCLVNMKYVKNIKCKLLELCGRASYNIFLTQMVYYCTFLPGYMQAHIGKMAVVFNTIICLVVGTLFYFMEKPLTTWVVKKTESMFVRLDKKMGEVNG